MSTPPGWYDDGSGSTRWWDGQRWSDASPGGGTSGGHDEPTSYSPASNPSNPSNPANPYGGGDDSTRFTDGSGSHGDAGGYGYGAGGYGASDGYRPSSDGDGSGRRRPKKNLVMIALVAVLALIIVGGGGVAAWLLLGRDDADDTEEASDTVADELTSATEAVYAVTTCEDELELVTGDRAEVVEAAIDQDSPYCDSLADFTYDLAPEEPLVDENDENAAEVTVAVTGTYAGNDDRYSDYERNVLLEFEKTDGNWLVTKRTIAGTTPEDAFEAYLSAGTCEEQLETVVGTRADNTEEAIDTDGSYCATAPETLYDTDLDDADVDEDGDEATIAAAVDVEAPDGDYSDIATASLEQTDLGWQLGDTVSEASRAAQAAFDYYTATSCAAEAELSTGSLKRQLEQAETEAASDPDHWCHRLAVYEYDYEFISADVNEDESSVIYNWDVTAPGHEDWAFSNSVRFDLELVDGEWLVSDATVGAQY